MAHVFCVAAIRPPPRAEKGARGKHPLSPLGSQWPAARTPPPHCNQLPVKQTNWRWDSSVNYRVRQDLCAIGWCEGDFATAMCVSHSARQHDYSWRPRADFPVPVPNPRRTHQPSSVAPCAVGVRNSSGLLCMAGTKRRFDSSGPRLAPAI